MRARRQVLSDWQSKKEPSTLCLVILSNLRIAYSRSAATFLSACDRLTHLDVSWCAVGDEGLAAIAQGCPGLKELKIMGCHDVTSRGVGHIASRSCGLLLLSLSHCGQVRLQLPSLSYCSYFYSRGSSLFFSHGFYF